MANERAYDERGNVRPADERWLGDPEPVPTTPAKKTK